MTLPVRIPDKTHRFYLTIFSLSLAGGVLSTIWSSLAAEAQGQILEMKWIIQLSFYFMIPAVLWPLFSPLIVKLSQAWPPQIGHPAWKKNLLKHFVLAACFAPLFRCFAVWFDFYVKHSLGMMSAPVKEAFPEVRHVIFSSTPNALLSYFIILGLYLLWKVQEKQVAEKGQLEEPLKVKDGGKLQLVFPKDVLWVETEGNYLKLHTKEHTYRLRSTLSRLYTQLDEQLFFRIHRSAIINYKAVESLQHWRRGEYLIRMKDNKMLTSSRGYRQEIQALLQRFRQNES